MKKTTKIIIAFVVIAVVATSAVLLMAGKSADETQSNTSGTDQAAKTIVYNDSGFSPAAITVASGSSVTIVNKSGDEIEPSSDPHPVHTDNPELNVGDIEAGKSKTVTLTTRGTWGYHNHYKKDNRGTITVE